jgi:hypothetical protein
MTEIKRYDKPINSMKTLETRLRNIISADGDPTELYSRLRQEISNVVVGQVIASVKDDAGDPVAARRSATTHGPTLTTTCSCLRRPARVARDARQEADGSEL